MSDTPAAADPETAELAARSRRRKLQSTIFRFIGIAATLVGLGTLVALVGDLVTDGGARISLDFFFSYTSADPARAGILAAWVGSLFVIVTTIVIAVPLGVLSGLYLEEYARKGPVTSGIEIAVNNLAAVPSIIFGLLALGLFVQQFALGATVLTAGLTLALLILPIVIVTTREAVRAVPQEIRQAALALGATKWQSTSHHVLPYALPGVVTGVIIGVSRALGETAPLICIGAATAIFSLPITLPGDPVQYEVGVIDAADPSATYTLKEDGATMVTFPDGRVERAGAGEEIEVSEGAQVETAASITDSIESALPTHWLTKDYTVMSIQMFNWTSQPEAAFRENAAAAGLVLLAITLLLNGAAIWLRYRLRRRIRW